VNEIAQVKTVAVAGPGGPAHAMMIAVNIGDPSSAEDFVGRVMEQFLASRMLAPPDTTLLLVTLIGNLTAQRFAARWQQLAERDEAVRAFMSLMTIADAVQGTPVGQELSKASLLPPVPSPAEKPWWKVW
jgi:hypothetical protein